MSFAGSAQRLNCQVKFSIQFNLKMCALSKSHVKILLGKNVFDKSRPELKFVKGTYFEDQISCIS